MYSPEPNDSINYDGIDPNYFTLNNTYININKCNSPIKTIKDDYNQKNFNYNSPLIQSYDKLYNNYINNNHDNHFITPKKYPLDSPRKIKSFFSPPPFSPNLNFNKILFQNYGSISPNQSINKTEILGNKMSFNYNYNSNILDLDDGPKNHILKYKSDDHKREPLDSISPKHSNIFTVQEDNLHLYKNKKKHPLDNINNNFKNNKNLNEIIYDYKSSYLKNPQDNYRRSLEINDKTRNNKIENRLIISPEKINLNTINLNNYKYENKNEIIKTNIKVKQQDNNNYEKTIEVNEKIRLNRFNGNENLFQKNNLKFSKVYKIINQEIKNNNIFLNKLNKFDLNEVKSNQINIYENYKIENNINKNEIRKSYINENIKNCDIQYNFYDKKNKKNELEKCIESDLFLEKNNIIDKPKKDNIKNKEQQKEKLNEIKFQKNDIKEGKNINNHKVKYKNINLNEEKALNTKINNKQKFKNKIKSENYNSNEKVFGNNNNKYINQKSNLNKNSENINLSKFKKENINEKRLQNNNLIENKSQTLNNIHDDIQKNNNIANNLVNNIKDTKNNDKLNKNKIQNNKKNQKKEEDKIKRDNINENINKKFNTIENENHKKIILDKEQKNNIIEYNNLKEIKKNNIINNINQNNINKDSNDSKENQNQLVVFNNKIIRKKNSHEKRNNKILSFDKEEKEKEKVSLIKKIRNLFHNEDNEDISKRKSDYNKINKIKKIGIEKKGNNLIKSFYEQNIKDFKQIMNSGERIENNFNPKDFKYIGVMGEGEFGRIYLAQWVKKDNQLYAMKIEIFQSRGEVYKRKIISKTVIEFLKKTNSEGIVRVYGDIWIKKNNLFFHYVLMEKAEKDMEKELIIRRKYSYFYTERDLINILCQLILTLAQLQKYNIAHRDIKPQNILIKNGRYKICDFGESIILNKSEIIIQKIRGTELYMSPIIFFGLKDKFKQVRHNVYKSDVFSLGLCILLAATLNYNCICQIREVTNMEIIKNIIIYYLSGRYSNKFISFLFIMLEVDENKRPDFIQLENMLVKR